MRFKSVFIQMETENGSMAFTSDRDSFQGVIRMNEIAGSIFQKISEGCSVKDAAEAVCAEYNTDEKHAEAVIAGCVKAFTEKGILICDENVTEVPEADLCNLMPVIEFMPYARDNENYADMNTGCYYNSCDCFSYDDCWTKD